jgi:hypothetical protein
MSIRIIDNTGKNKPKKLPEVPFFTKDSNGDLYLVYKTIKEKYSSIDMRYGSSVNEEFSCLEEMFNTPSYRDDIIVNAEIILSDK